MKKFIDLGAKGVNGFIFDTTGYEVYKIDPLLERGDRIINEAAWVFDGELEFTKCDREISSTHIREKRDWGKGEIIKVKCFNFPKWLEQFKDEYVVVKMNIEGAEIELLENMIETEKIKLIKELYVEWHSGKIAGMPGGYDERRIEICNKLNQLGIAWQKTGR